MIQTIFLRSLRNSEFIRFNKDVLSICSNNNPVALGIPVQVAALQTATVPLDDLFVKERGNLITPELEALDARRDDALTGIRVFAEAQTYHYDPVIEAAGQQVLSAMDKYGRNLPRLNYIAETEVIDSLTDDFSTDADLVAATTTLNLQEWVKELSTANTLFNSRYLARNTNYAAQPGGNLQEQRNVTTDAYRVLADHITAHATITPSAVYTKLINEINTLVDQYNQLINNRSGSGEEEQPVDAPNTPGELV
jgi:Family of unknown function (DUF6261)